MDVISYPQDSRLTEVYTNYAFHFKRLLKDAEVLPEFSQSDKLATTLLKKKCIAVSFKIFFFHVFWINLAIEPDKLYKPENMDKRRRARDTFCNCNFNEMAKKHKIEEIPKQNANWSNTLDNLTKGYTLIEFWCWKGQQPNSHLGRCIAHKINCIKLFALAEGKIN